MQLAELNLVNVYLPSFLGIGLTGVFTAPLGTKLAHKLPAQKLKRCFLLLIILMAVKLMWS
ncbi:TSUP family transporter [Candidatus Methylobacter favarea]|uniref:TSUP family transporter n=1 Tax=Candidatus Methylobacter favarea TaxID=2707345 RepID=UPI001FEB84E2|nr:TSUP family transporter [Candidatus Methylobacter favarea]